MDADDSSVRVLREFLRDLQDEVGGTLRISLQVKNKHTGKTVDVEAPVLALEVFLPELDLVLARADRYTNLLEAAKDVAAIIHANLR